MGEVIMKKAILFAITVFTFSGCCRWLDHDNESVMQLLKGFCTGKVTKPDKQEKWVDDKKHQAALDLKQSQLLPRAEKLASINDEKVLRIDVKSLREVIRDAWDLSEIRDFEDLANFVVVDVRGFQRYQDCRIRGSINIPLKDLKHESASWPANRKIIVYSDNSSCPLAAKAARRLIEYGFEKVFICDGGLNQWLAKGFEYDGAHPLIS